MIDGAVRDLLSPVKETPQLRTLRIPLNLYKLNDLHSHCSWVLLNCQS